MYAGYCMLVGSTAFCVPCLNVLALCLSLAAWLERERELCLVQASSQKLVLA